MILGEAPEACVSPQINLPAVWPMSAKSKSALRALRCDLLET
ncbi:hypothetical protein [Xenorhabdus szentirmaii]|nr:hypothetical protein [Xenorhabdus sp. CUL]MBD2825497.1 hypothetical protein [Xenorhabdus sp. 5]